MQLKDSADRENHKFQQIQDKVIRLVLALIPHAKVYLYESRARGTQRPFSDIDIAIDAGEKIERHRIAEIQRILEAASIPYNFDITGYRAISDEMRTHITKEMIEWKQ